MEREVAWSVGVGRMTAELAALRERAERAEGRATLLETEHMAHFGACHDQLNAAIARVIALKALLRSVEWVNTDDGDVLVCPRCGWVEREGHGPACPLGAALADGG